MTKQELREHYTAVLQYVPADPIDLVPVADALLLLCADTTLYKALELAQDVNTRQYQHEAQRQALTAAADELRSQLSQIEDQLRRAA